MNGNYVINAFKMYDLKVRKKRPLNVRKMRLNVRKMRLLNVRKNT